MNVNAGDVNKIYVKRDLESGSAPPLGLTTVGTHAGEEADGDAGFALDGEGGAAAAVKTERKTASMDDP